MALTNAPYLPLPGSMEEYKGDDGFGVGIESALTDNPAAKLYEAGELYLAKKDKEGEFLSKESAEKLAEGQRVKIDFPKEGISKKAADLMIERAYKKQKIAYEQSLLQNGNTLSYLGGQLVGSVVDPINVASAFIPVGNALRLGGMINIARTGSSAVSRMGARAVVGAAEGLVGAAAVEPISYAASQYLQDEYGLGDSIMNLVVGTGMGAGLHVGAGALGDAFRPGNKVAAHLESQPVETRSKVFAEALRQTEAGQPIDLTFTLTETPFTVQDSFPGFGKSSDPAVRFRDSLGAAQEMGLPAFVTEGGVKSKVVSTSEEGFVLENGKTVKYTELKTSKEGGLSRDSGSVKPKELEIEIGAQSNGDSAVNKIAEERIFDSLDRGLEVQLDFKNNRKVTVVNREGPFVVDKAGTKYRMSDVLNRLDFLRATYNENFSSLDGSFSADRKVGFEALRDQRFSKEQREMFSPDSIANRAPTKEELLAAHKQSYPDAVRVKPEILAEAREFSGEPEIPSAPVEAKPVEKILDSTPEVSPSGEVVSDRITEMQALSSEAESEVKALRERKGLNEESGPMRLENENIKETKKLNRARQLMAACMGRIG